MDSKRANTTPERPPSSEATSGPPPVGRPRSAPPWLAWTITIGEVILWGAAAVVLGTYWRMLPLPHRFGGAGVLALVAVFGSLRLRRFYRQRGRQTASEAVAAKAEAK